MSKLKLFFAFILTLICFTLITSKASATATWYYPDADHDGFGDSAALTPDLISQADYDALSTDQQLNYVSNGLDCDDSNRLVNPDSPEICDNDTDDDCDPSTDDKDTDVCVTPGSGSSEPATFMCPGDMAPIYSECTLSTDKIKCVDYTNPSRTVLVIDATDSIGASFTQLEGLAPAAFAAVIGDGTKTLIHSAPEGAFVIEDTTSVATAFTALSGDRDSHFYLCQLPHVIKLAAIEARDAGAPPETEDPTETDCPEGMSKVDGICECDDPNLMVARLNMPDYPLICAEMTADTPPLAICPNPEIMDYIPAKRLCVCKDPEMAMTFDEDDNLICISKSELSPITPTECPEGMSKDAEGICQCDDPNQVVVRLNMPNFPLYCADTSADEPSVISCPNDDIMSFIPEKRLCVCTDETMAMIVNGEGNFVCVPKSELDPVVPDETLPDCSQGMRFSKITKVCECLDETKTPVELDDGTFVCEIPDDGLPQDKKACPEGTFFLPQAKSCVCKNKTDILIVEDDAEPKCVAIQTYVQELVDKAVAEATSSSGNDDGITDSTAQADSSETSADTSADADTSVDVDDVTDGIDMENGALGGGGCSLNVAGSAANFGWFAMLLMSLPVLLRFRKS